MLNEKQLNAVLCYVNSPWAYFTTQPLNKQDGEDWRKVPYEHNASVPDRYNPKYDKEEAPWEIVKVAYAADLETPGYYMTNSPWSVKQINAGAVAWLISPSYVKNPVVIPAGTTLRDFIKIIREAGGEVYLPIGDEEGE